MSHTTAARRASLLLVGACSVAALAACNTAATKKIVIPPLNTPEVVTSSAAPVFPPFTNFDRQFPMVVIDGKPGSPDATVRRGTATADNTGDPPTSVTITIGSDVFTLTPTAVPNQYQDGSGNFYTVYQRGLFIAFVAEGLNGPNEFAGGYGYQTPDAYITTAGTATYATDALARLTFAEDGAGDLIRLGSTGPGSVNLTANFGGAGMNPNTISGTLFFGSGMVDADGGGIPNDTLEVTTTLTNGTITNGTFTGNVDASIQVGQNGGPLVPGTITTSNTDVNGVFYSDTALSAAASYGGRYDATLLPGNTSTGAFVGYSHASVP